MNIRRQEVKKAAEAIRKHLKVDQIRREALLEPRDPLPDLRHLGNVRVREGRHEGKAIDRDPVVVTYIGEIETTLHRHHDELVPARSQRSQ